MANEQNLRSIADRPDFMELSAKGGREAQKKLRKARNMREAARYLLESPVLGDEETAAALAELGLEADYQSAILLAAARKSAGGDIEAARYVRDTSGQAPSQQVELGGIDGRPIEILDLGGMTTEQLNALLAAQDDGK